MFSSLIKRMSRHIRYTTACARCCEINYDRDNKPLCGSLPFCRVDAIIIPRTKDSFSIDEVVSIVRNMGIQKIHYFDSLGKLRRVGFAPPERLHSKHFSALLTNDKLSEQILIIMGKPSSQYRVSQFFTNNGLPMYYIEDEPVFPVTKYALHSYIEYAGQPNNKSALTCFEDLRSYVLKNACGVDW